MDKTTIKHLLLDLDWNADPQKQNAAIEQLIHIDSCYFPLLINWSKKSTWENSVKVIIKIGYPRNKALIPQLIAFLRDPNWPGSTDAIITLQNLPVKEIMSFWEDAIKTAYEQRDGMWLTGIHSILVDELSCTINDFSDEDIFYKLKEGDSWY